MKFTINIPTWLWVFTHLTQITFITLKLFNIISWNWFMVFSPLLAIMGMVYLFWLICSITFFFKKIRR